jgi:hypothetical protein
MIDMKKIIAVVIIVLTGCSGIPKPNTASWDPAPRDQSKGEFWNPTAEEKSRAVSLGRWFANKHLGLSKNDVEKMRTGSWLITMHPQNRSSNNPVHRITIPLALYGNR